MTAKLTLFLFILFSFFPGTKNFAGDQLAASSMLPLFIVGLYAKLTALLWSVSFPQHRALIGKLNQVTAFCREHGLKMTLGVSIWLTYSAISAALFKGIFAWNLLVLAALTPFLYWLLFIKDASWNDLFQADNSNRQARSRTHKIALGFCRALTAIVVFSLPIFFVGDLYNSPALDLFK